MNCIVTAGPTYEELDRVRRLTNFSTGQLGSELANHLVAQGHHVTLLLGHYATWRGPQHAQCLQIFTTTNDLRERLRTLSAPTVNAVFHAAAVSDFAFGKVWERLPDNSLIECRGGKISTRTTGTLLAELVPTPKIISELRNDFPHACLVGWKFEVDGGRTEVLDKAARQILDSCTDACVANGSAYGEGFGLVTRAGAHTHFAERSGLFGALEQLSLSSDYLPRERN